MNFKYLIFNNLLAGCPLQIDPKSTTKHHKLPQNSHNLLVPHFDLLERFLEKRSPGFSSAHTRRSEQPSTEHQANETSFTHIART